MITLTNIFRVYHLRQGKALLTKLVEVNREREEVIAENSALRDVVEQALMEARRSEGRLRQAHGQEQALADGLQQQHQQNAFLQQFAKPAAEPKDGYGASGDATSWDDIESSELSSTGVPRRRQCPSLPFYPESHHGIT